MSRHCVVRADYKKRATFVLISATIVS